MTPLSRIRLAALLGATLCLIVRPLSAQAPASGAPEAMQRIGDVWSQLFPAEQQRITRLLIERVQLHGHGLDIVWREDGWIGFGADISTHPLIFPSRRKEKILS